MLSESVRVGTNSETDLCGYPGKQLYDGVTLNSVASRAGRKIVYKEMDR